MRAVPQTNTRSIPVSSLLRASHAKLSAIAALILLGVAGGLVATVRVFPDGFEAQAVWFVTLLPGALPAYAISDLLYRLAPRASDAGFWIVLATFSFLWYWLLSYVLLRFFRSRFKPWNGF
jgi:hypothetical protein